MVKTVLYIATSLDGFIAKPDGNLDWLTSTPYPESGDYGYEELLSSIGTTIMGRKTYEEVLGFGVEWPYSGLSSYVVTTNKEYKVATNDTYAFSGDVKELVTDIKRNAEKDIWLIGGGELVTLFMNAQLIDRMIITIIPKIIGEGIPLFAPTPRESEWRLSEVKSFETGVVILCYEQKE